MEIRQIQDSERKRDRHRGQCCSGISHTRKESDLAEGSRDLMLLKGYRNRDWELKENITNNCETKLQIRIWILALKSHLCLGLKGIWICISCAGLMVFSGWICQSFLQTAVELRRTFPSHMHGNISMTIWKKAGNPWRQQQDSALIQGLWSCVTALHCSGCSTKDKNDSTSLTCWMAWQKERAPPALNSLYESHSSLSQMLLKISISVFSFWPVLAGGRRLNSRIAP